MAGGGVFRIGTSVINAKTGELSRANETTGLGKRTLELLLALLDVRGQLVSNEELLRRVWPGLVVETNTIQVHVSLLRKALGPDRGFLQTLSGRGYRLQMATEANDDVSPVYQSNETGDEHGSNLPHRLDRIIGRGQEIEQLRSALSEHRLVTIVGTGGVGKTRLAIEAGKQLRDQFRDGAWLVDFAAIRDPELVVMATASTLGIATRSQSQALADLVAALASSQRLLIFDNCEYQSEAIAGVVRSLLRGAFGLSILVTSQEPLNVAGEHLFPLAPLPVPASNNTDISQFAAVALFIDRAQAGNPSFAVTTATAPMIAEICSRLDGVPLAIEMAVGRLPVLGLKSLAEGLDDRLQLLRGTSLGADLRHRTLLAMVQWSIGLLSSSEAKFFSRLGIFPASFSIDAAVRVAGEGNMNRWEAFDLLGQLVSKSLVVVVHQEPPRYRLLETLRLFALNELQRGEYHETAQRLAQWLIECFTSANAEWEFISDREWKSRYYPETDNIRCALKWGFGSPERTPLTVALASATARLWRGPVRRHEGQSYLVRALELSSDALQPAMRAGLLMEQAEFFKIDSPSTAVDFAKQSNAIFRQQGDNLPLARGLIVQAYLLSRLGEHQGATAAFAEAEQCLEGNAYPKTLCNLFSNLGTHAAFERRLDEAGACFSKVLTQARRIADGVREAAALANLAEIAFANQEVETAIALARDALHALDAQSQPSERVVTLANLAGYLVARELLTDAATAIEEALLLTTLMPGIPRHYVHIALARCAALGVRSNNLPQAAFLVGFTAPFFQVEGGLGHEVHEREMFDATRASLQMALDATEFQSCLKRGRLYSEAEAVRVALEKLISPLLATQATKPLAT